MSISQRLFHNIYLLTSFSHTRISHKAFPTTSSSHRLSRNVSQNTFFSERLITTSFPQRHSNNVVITLFHYIFVLTTYSSQHYEQSISMLYVQTAIISTICYPSNSTSSSLIPSIDSVISNIFGRLT